ncbi:hypothetical protein TIFTF001_001279 [Ficus carica]|uniref:Uncharacterized protein n=1 Tax=Ficus carica TaxID=3494 RepID=A0AA87Z612_FICCA|nr:hypothetical protein TIFTF001_001279 [Ficus carica]
MADRRRWLSMESQSKFNKAIDLFLLDWTEFQSAVDVYREIKKEKFSAHVFDFFATTAVPTVDGLTKKLFNAMSILEALIGLNFCQEAAEPLLDAYNDYLASEGLNSLEISRESLLAFKQSMDTVLSNWLDFQTAAHMIEAHRRHDLASAIFRLLAKTAEPNVDGLAEEMHRVISNTLDGRIDSSNCSSKIAGCPSEMLGRRFQNTP